MRLATMTVAAAMAMVVSTGPAQAAKHCDEPGTRWERATPAEAGMDAAKVADAVAFAQRKTSTAVRVYRYGCLVVEDSLNPESVAIPGQSFSLAKSLVSLAFGRAWTLGLIGPDDPVGALFPEADAAHGVLTMRELLTMTTGLSQVTPHDFNLAMADRVRDVLTLPLVAEPGETWAYFQSGPPTVTAAVGRAAGEDFQTFLQRQLLTPIGVRPGSWLWTRDLVGSTAGFWGLFMRPDDYARIGELLRRGGVWRGRRLLSERYVRDAVQPGAVFGCYGWFIWRPTAVRCNWASFLGLPGDAWQFNGFSGQLVTAFPKTGIMTVRTGVDPSQHNWAAAVGTSGGGEEREFYTRVLGAITDTSVVVSTQKADPSWPTARQQMRRDDPGANATAGLLSSVNQPSLPAAGPWRARAGQVDEQPVRADRQGRFVVTVHCPPIWLAGDARCTGTLTAKHGRRPVTVDVGPDGTARVRLRLTARALRRVNRHGHLDVATTLTLHDATTAGTTTQTLLAVLRPPRGHR